jgi:hypothetical protein
MIGWKILTNKYNQYKLKTGGKIMDFKETNEPLEMKKQIIKTIITPFFKNNGFIKKGVKYYKNINHLIIMADIQSQRYYKEEKIEKFRINVSIYPDNTNGTAITFWTDYIGSPETSWITINGATDIEELKIMVINKLNEKLIIMDRYNNVGNLIKILKIDINETNKIIMEKKNELEKETENKNLIYILKNTINNCEKRINIINDWIKIVNG